MIIPAGWVCRSLHEVAEIRTGATLSARQKMRDPVHLPYMRVANVQDGWFDLQDIAGMQVERHNVGRYLLQEGDVLITEGGDADKVGRGHIWRGQITPCLHQNHVFAVRCTPSLLPDFFNLLKSSRYGKAYFAACAKQTTGLASISASELREFPVLLPPPDKQREIVKIIHSFDQAVQASQKILDNSRTEHALWLRTLFAPEVRLGGKRVPWQTATLQQLADFGGLAITRDTPDDFSFRYIEISDVSSGRIRPDLQTLRKKDAPSRARREVQAGDILLSTVRPHLKAIAKAGEEHEGCIASTGLAVLRAKDGVLADFLYHSLYSEAVQQQFAQRASGSNYPQLKLGELQHLQMQLPPWDMQCAIANILDDAERRVQLEERSLILLQDQRAWVLEQLLSGREGKVA